MSERSLLENMVLAIVAERGPCTPYAVRKVFVDSPSSHWSGSAGAIYPLVARLEKSGLLVSTPAPEDRRRTRVLTITEAGRVAMLSWLASPITDADRSVPFDPFRARLFFLGMLPEAERRRVLDEAVRTLDDAMRQAEAYYHIERAGGDYFARMGALGGVAAARARVAWLEEVVRGLEGEKGI